MTAINVLVQQDAAYMLTDSAVYLSDGGLLETNFKKPCAILNGRAAIACTGPALLCRYIAGFLDAEFITFDELTERGEKRIGELFNEYVSENRNGDAASTLYMIGWSDAANAPSAYGMDMQTKGTKADWLEKNKTHHYAVEDFKLLKLDQIGSIPFPPIEMVREAGYDLTSDLSSVDAETDLLHMMEIQRQFSIEGIHYVGGSAMLTSIDVNGIAQRVVHTWTDKVGDVICPEPVNWKQWIADHKPTFVPPAGLSRLQRERLAKKVRKGTLRAA